MAWVQEAIDFVLKLKPWMTVQEYERGLYFFNGRVLEMKIPERKLIEIIGQLKEEGKRPKDIGQILKEEEDMALKHKKIGIRKHNPLARPDYEDGFRRDMFGMPQHPDRYSKNRPRGIYLTVPPILDITRVETVPIMEVVRDLKFISVLKENGYTNMLSIGDKTQTQIEKKENPKYESIFLSGLLRYQIEDAYKAYTQVQDWEKSYHTQALIILSRIARETPIQTWTESDKVEELEKKFKERLNATPARKYWGIWTAETAITDVVPHTLVRNVQEIYGPDGGLTINHDIVSKAD